MDSFFEYDYIESVDLPLPCQHFTDIYRFDGKINKPDNDRRSMHYMEYYSNANYPGYEGI